MLVLEIALGVAFGALLIHLSKYLWANHNRAVKRSLGVVLLGPPAAVCIAIAVSWAWTQAEPAYLWLGAIIPYLESKMRQLGGMALFALG